MAQVIDKIVRSKYPPRDTRVLWLDGTNNTLKSFYKGKWSAGKGGTGGGISLEDENGCVIVTSTNGYFLDALYEAVDILYSERNGVEVGRDFDPSPRIEFVNTLAPEAYYSGKKSTGETEVISKNIKDEGVADYYGFYPDFLEIDDCEYDLVAVKVKPILYFMIFIMCTTSGEEMSAYANDELDNKSKEEYFTEIINDYVINAYHDNDSLEEIYNAIYEGGVVLNNNDAGINGGFFRIFIVPYAYVQLMQFIPFIPS